MPSYKLSQDVEGRNRKVERLIRLYLERNATNTTIDLEDIMTVVLTAINETDRTIVSNAIDRLKTRGVIVEE